MKKMIKVKPNAKQQQIIPEADGSLTIFLKSSPVDGKANAELIAILAQHFDVAKNAVTIKLGHTGKQELVEIVGL